MSSTDQTEEMTVILSTTEPYSDDNNSTLFNISSWKLNDLHDDLSSSSFLRQNLLTLILYLLCALIALTLLIILFSIIIFTYRKHCFPSPSSSPILGHRHQMNKTKPTNRVGIQIEHENSNIQTIDNTVRPCFE